MEDPRAAFAAEMEKPDHEIDLGRAALLIAAEEYPDLDVDAYLRRLDDLAGRVRAGEDLYRDLGFHGNRDDYYDPRNSYLNEVIDRRTGIPITLSVVHMEVAKRLGRRLEGVNLPSHFLLAEGDTLIDPFEGGAVVTPEDCQRRLASIHGRTVELRPEHFERIGPRAILRRMLNNLRAIHVQREDYPRALAALDRMQLCLPTIDATRDRGLVLFRLGRHKEAEAELVRYLAVAGEAPDRSAVVQHLDWVRRLRAGMN